MKRRGFLASAAALCAGVFSGKLAAAKPSESTKAKYRIVFSRDLSHSETRDVWATEVPGDEAVRIALAEGAEYVQVYAGDEASPTVEMYFIAKYLASQTAKRERGETVLGDFFSVDGFRAVDPSLRSQVVGPEPSGAGMCINK